MFDVFYEIIVDALRYFHGFTGNYGWDIIVLTLIVRVVLFPLTLKGMRGMKAMQAHQPHIKELQAKYKDDKERLNKEMMAFYKEVGFNPMSSCLPMLLQMPVFIVLYRVLSLPELNGYLLVNESFYGMNLTSAAFTKMSPDFLKDITLIMPGMVDLSFLNFSYFNGAYLYTPVLIVVALMTVTTVMQQKMMTVDPQQQSTMWFMNIFIVYISFIMPAGVLLYWGVSNLLQLAQQAFMKSPVDAKVGAKKTGSSKSAGAITKGGVGTGKKQAKTSDNIKKKKESAKTKASDGDSQSGAAEKMGSSLSGKKSSYPASGGSGSKKKKKKRKKKKKK